MRSDNLNAEYWARATDAEIEAAATAYFGIGPNRALSSKEQLRYGTKGSKTVALENGDRGSWYDFDIEHGEYLRRPEDGVAPRQFYDPRAVFDAYHPEHIDDFGEAAAPEPKTKADAAKVAGLIWTHGRDIAGTVAEAYLRKRGILPSGDLVEALKYGEYNGDRMLLASARTWAGPNAKGKFVAVQRIYLKEDGTKDRGADGLQAAKKLRGSTKQPDGTPAFWIMRGGPKVYVHEGIEDALATRKAFEATGREIPTVVATFGVGRLEKAAAVFHGAIFVADNDKAPKAKEAARLARGSIVDLSGFDGCNDANEVLQAEGAEALAAALLAAKPLVDAGDKPASLIVAKPFIWIDPALLPSRRFLYGRHLISKFVSATIAPGGIGKSSLIMGEALDMVSGGKVYGLAKHPLNVWTFNGEDPEDEIQRKLTASILHFNLDPAEVTARLFMNSGRSSELVIGEDTRDGAVIHKPVVDALISQILALKIDVLQIDPFVSAHRVSENDNNKIDRVVKTFCRIAEITGCAIELVHHVRKPLNGQSETTADDARGASSLVSAARDVRTLNRATSDCAAFLKTDGGVFEPRSFFRLAGDKTNLTPPQTDDDWRRLISVSLPNGDHVGVVALADRLDLLDGVTAAHLESVVQKIAAIPEGMPFDCRAKGWVGELIAEVTAIDMDAPGGRKRVEKIRDLWIENKALVVRVVTRPKGDRDQKRVFSGGWQ